MHRDIGEYVMDKVGPAFRVACSYMDENKPSKAAKIVNDLTESMREYLEKASWVSTSALSLFIDIESWGKSIDDESIDKKDYDDRVSRIQSQMRDISPGV